MPVISSIPRRRPGQTPLALNLALWLVLTAPQPAPAQSSTDPVLVGAAQPVDTAWSLMSSGPLRIGDLTAAETLLRQADQVLGPAIGTANPAAWAQERGIDRLLLIEVFNRFNETTELVEAARRFHNTVIWSPDPATRRYLDEKSRRLAAAKRALSPAHFQLFLGVGRDGDPSAAVTRPWTRLSGPRYGFDVGRFRREERADLGSAGRVMVDKHVLPFPWLGPPPQPLPTVRPPPGVTAATARRPSAG
jgi:hypothetical protein